MSLGHLVPSVVAAVQSGDRKLSCCRPAGLGRARWASGSGGVAGGGLGSVF